jgi:hypothetical protein
MYRVSSGEDSDDELDDGEISHISSGTLGTAVLRTENM